VLDAAKIKEDINWSPKYNLSDGLDKTINYFKKLAAKGNC